ncbi:acyltransferase [Clostridium autoethanogenum]|uniref:Acyltransferase n=1 Tax=Clostridium autoethanogenum TaxID=84023 RepID=A0A3M0T142_9CLOT|nr:acyltransferase [Clostridium autoethanogenum]RMD04337.1 acyltransferase [Clostridium autoethanogenum]
MKIISKSSRISKLCDIEDSVLGSKVIVGDNSFIDSFVKIKFSGGLEDIVIGNNTYINSGTVIYSGNGIKIGNDVMIAANCTLAPTNHKYTKKNMKIIEQGFMKSKGGIIIEDDVWIGANSVILDGAIIRKGCVIGAHSLVGNIELKEYGIYAGNPIKIIGERE